MLKNGDFDKLLSASLISQTGSHFLTIALAAFVLISSGSPVQSALVFVLSFLPSIVVSARLGHWVDSSISKWLIARNEALAIVTSALCGVCIYFKLPLAALCVVLAARSVLIFITRAAAGKWIKVITPPELQTDRIKLFFLSFFLSTTIAGILASVILSRGTIWYVVGLDIATYLIGIGIFLTLKPLSHTEAIEEANDFKPPHLVETLKYIFMMPNVRVLFLFVCFSQAIFQGAYSSLVSLLPIQYLGLGVGGTGYFQIAASIGIIGGFLINWYYPKVFMERGGTFPKRTLAAAVLGVLLIFISVKLSTPLLSMLSFFGFNLAYECIWLHNNSEFFRASPKSSVARYQFTISASAAFLMSTMTLGYSALIQYLGITTGVVIALILGILGFIISTIVTRVEQVVPTLERVAK